MRAGRPRPCVQEEEEEFVSLAVKSRENTMMPFNESLKIQRDRPQLVNHKP